jgi:ABC-type polysaccharide/polyol phosphate export permease
LATGSTPAATAGPDRRRGVYDIDAVIARSQRRLAAHAARRDFDVAGALWTLVRTDFKVRYHGTAMGFVWATLKPAAMFVVLMSVFTLVFASKTDYALDLVLGLFLYDYFQESTKGGSSRSTPRAT